MIFLSFVGSMAINFILNPFIWVVAGCYIHNAEKEDRVSKWQFYPGFIGIVLTISLGAVFFGQFKIPSKLLEQSMSRQDEGAGEHSKGGAPEVSGIMFTSDPKALINGYVLKPGEEIDGFVIEEIRESSVVFLAPDGTKTVRRVK